MKIVYTLLGLLVWLGAQAQSHVQELETGLELITIKSPVATNPEITVLRINPNDFDFVMKNASAKKVPERLPMDVFAKKAGLLAAVNAGMFELDGVFLTATGYTANYKHINNARLRKDYKLILAFNPKDNSVPPMQLIDLSAQNWDLLKTKYHSFSQGLRVVTGGKNVWKQQAKKWSMVLWGTDKAGNALWIFTRFPYSVHNFANILLQTDLDIDKIMYLEGGPEASFWLNHELAQRALMGSYETGFNEDDKNKRFWELPNIIGIQRKKK